MASDRREPAVAGTWYPGRREALVAELDRHLAQARPRSPRGPLVALISPHAGLRYSGPVAAWGYALLRESRVQTVVLVGPSHRVPFRGVSVWPRGEWASPLGAVPIDEAVASRLLAADTRLTDDRRPHLAEHSLEMQLPFLKHLLPELSIVPALMGSQTRDEVDMLAQALGQALVGEPVLLVASSDLSHYHPSVEAERLDRKVIEDLERFDTERLMQRLEANYEHACGGGPMVAVMKAAASMGAREAVVLRYADSGDVEEGDKSRVVGYLSAALSGSAA